jgi:hypothetical protein
VLVIRLLTRRPSAPGYRQDMHPLLLGGLSGVELALILAPLVLLVGVLTLFLWLARRPG